MESAACESPAVEATHHHDLTVGMPNVRVGWLLARARRSAGLREPEVAATLGVPVSSVRLWESGREVPDDDIIRRFARSCGTDLAALIPVRDVVEFDVADQRLRVGSAVVFFEAPFDNDDVLAAYVGLVRAQRGLSTSARFTPRHEDLPALARALDLDDADLIQRLMGVMGMSASQAAAIHAQLRRHRAQPDSPADLLLGLVAGPR